MTGVDCSSSIKNGRSQKVARHVPEGFQTRIQDKRLLMCLLTDYSYTKYVISDCILAGGTGA